jgi:hypothetical protein
MMRRLALTPLIVVILVSSACRGGRFIRQYEYEEEIYLDVDGSATVRVNASLLALHVLRGIDVPVDPRARLDRQHLRRAFESSVARVTRVSPWRRHGRQFVHVRLEVDDIRTLSGARPFDWSLYSLEQSGEAHVFRQVIRGVPVDLIRAGGVKGSTAWDGSERVAFRLHLPSRIQYHNVRDLETGEPRGVERGNILTWEQRLTDRLAARPLEMEARIETESILYRTLWLFAGAFGAAVLALAALIWWTAKRGRESFSSDAAEKDSRPL